MKAIIFSLLMCLSTLLAQGQTQCAVSITTPTNNLAVRSPVQVSAQANCSVRAMQLYVDGKKISEQPSSTLKYSLTTNSGTHRVTVQAIDAATNLFKATVNIAVSSSPGTATFDTYGGINAKPSMNGTSANFRVEKFGKHWMLVTPAGHAFFMKGVFDVSVDTHTDALGSSYQARAMAKYGNLTNWAAAENTRLKSWGFNSLAEYTMTYNQNSAVQMPWVASVRPSRYGLLNNTTGAQVVKDLVNGAPTTFKGYRGGTTPDVFDPNFALFCDKNFASVASMVNNQMVIGIAIDDSDNINGFGPGPDVPSGHTHTHIGYLVAITNPRQTANTKLNVSAYSDTVVYSKLALRDFLAAKYGTIAGLNAAWGSKYTTFDTAGGYGAGTGFMDEDGRHTAYLGSDPTMTTVVNATVKADLDAFLYEYSKQYFSVTTGAVRKYAPKKLVMGPATLNGWGGVSRKEVLQAAGKYLDIIQASVNSQKVADLTAAAAGDRPLITWRGAIANPDSTLYRYPGGMPTQVARAQWYDAAVLGDFKMTVSSTGNQPVVGFKFWALVDSVAEKSNWGLETTSDNPYDGTASIVNGEERDYGDFIHPATMTNRKIDNLVLSLP